MAPKKDRNSKRVPPTPKEKPLYTKNKVKFEVYGEEMIEKEVRLAGNSGRIYLPPDWIGKPVKIIRIE